MPDGDVPAIEGLSADEAALGRIGIQAGVQERVFALDFVLRLLCRPWVCYLVSPVP